MRTTMGAVAALASVAIVLAHAAPLAQDPQQPAARFRGGVALLTVQTSVVDKAGHALTDLQPGDFTVTVDGKPRKVSFARFNRADEVTTAAADASAGGAPAAPATNTTSATGRIVIFVVDRDSIRSGTERALLDASAELIGSLTPADAVGLVGIPTGAVELTRDHARVREQLVRMTGSEPRLMSGLERLITWEEAYEIADHRNARVMAEVIERECPRSGSPNCPKLLEEQAREILQVGRGHVRTTLSVLTRLAKRLESVHGSKHVILLSGGKAFDQDLLPDYREFARQSAASGLVVHSIHLDAPADDASVRRRTGSAFGGRDMATGLTTISGLTGGAYYSAVARATGVFDRIRTEISSFYELGVESTAADADGRAHDIDVKVNRPGVRVRARQQVMVPAATAADAKATPADPLIALLQRQAVDVAEVPIALATYTTRGTEPTMLKVMLSAEMGGPQTRAPAEWAYVIFDKDEKLAADGRRTIDEAGSGPWAVTTSAQLAPGRYRIRFAAIDAEGREGVLDRPLRIGLRAAGGLQMSDLIVGTAAGGRLQARSRVAQGERLSALLELMTADTALLGRSRAAFELIPAGTAEPALRVLMAARTSGSDAVLLNGADIDTTTLAPGRYTASAVALVDGRPVGRVSRVIDVVAR